MTYCYERFSNAPDIVRQLTICFDAFIVGGAAKYLLGETSEVKDWDIIVPLSRWGQAQKLIPKDAIHNTFGGSKIIRKFGEIEYIVDIWSQDLSEYLIGNSSIKVAIVHPKSLFSGTLDYGY